MAVLGIMLFCIIKESLPALIEIGGGLFDMEREWRPLSGTPSYNILPMILATLYVSVLAVLIAVPLGLGCALFLCCYAKKGAARLAFAFVDLLAGVPSVIFGFLGLVVVVKFLENNLQMNSGECVLAAGVVLAVMLFPFVVSSCGESVGLAWERYAIPALALGASKEYALRKAILPAAGRGISAGLMLALGRAMGETMAVMMVLGNSPILPRLLGRGETIASLTALEMGSVEYGSLHLSAIYAANLILILLLGLLYFAAYRLKRSMGEESDAR